MDRKSNYSENLNKVLFLAEKLAEEYGSSYIGSEHLVFAMLNLPECTAYKILCRQNVSAEKYRDFFIRTIDRHCNVEGFTPMTKHIIQVVEEFGEFVSKTNHLLLAIICSEDCLAMCILRALGTDMHKLFSDVGSSNSEDEQ